ncbi:ribosomal protein S5 domain 2-type protein [Gamsiella multidivaricata]|uniref:ribosomal protein S5 domain 2-type protein n=1 Tax=Gamsiella multidivaricata TaxID=101098 RepID=UPI00221E6773|nr:ribosomal protein S5 domain 2-type protein [Gamsiella multidivaricata]KAI7818076.1 ribosomal protein S5 domain 2-type protein [Gamsiella multidivaricata]
MSRVELLSPEGLRVDGRRPAELRKITSATAVLSQADGSAYLEHGNTKVLAAVYGPREARHRALVAHDRAILNVEFNVAPFSTGERRRRTKNDKRLLEMASFVKQTFEPVVVTTLYPRSQIDIYLQVIQQDGGVLQACVNAATMALIDAGIAMTDYVCACTAGWIEREAAIDLNHMEEVSDTSEVTIAMLPKSGKVTLAQMESRLHVDKLEEVLSLASEGCKQIHLVVDKTIRDRVEELARKMAV